MPGVSGTVVSPPSSNCPVNPAPASSASSSGSRQSVAWFARDGPSNARKAPARAASRCTAPSGERPRWPRTTRCGGTPNSPHSSSRTSSAAVPSSRWTAIGAPVR